MIKNALPFIETYTGKKFYFLDPTEDSICIEDIAHALSNKCRFAGHCSSFYSVAEHSFIVSILVSPDLALAGLLHDAAEAYLEDIPSPIKPYLKEYKKFEDQILQVIFKKYNVEYPADVSIKVADRVQLVSEGRYLLPSQGKDFAQIEGRHGKKPKCLFPPAAEILFLDRFYELRNETPIGKSLILAA